MKRKRQSKLADLNFDVLRRIMFYVAESPNGAVDLARSLSVCRLFKELADDSDVLKAVEFEQVEISGIHGSFWQPDGLLCRCILIGNPTAFDTITKNKDILDASYVILKTEMFRSKLSLLYRSRAVEVANTRARKKALDDAVDECTKIFDAVDVQIQTTEQFLDMLKAVLKVLRSQVAQ